jgi:hypothetical protein
MNEISDWMQSHWFELGSLLIQCAILATVVWYSRKSLKTMRGSQEQVGALLRLSLSELIAERPTLTEAPAFTAPESAESAGSRVSASWRNLIRWLQAPMSSGGAAPWHRVVRWLQAPAGS